MIVFEWIYSGVGYLFLTLLLLCCLHFPLLGPFVLLGGLDKFDILHFSSYSREAFWGMVFTMWIYQIVVFTWDHAPEDEE